MYLGWNGFWGGSEAPRAEARGALCSMCILKAKLQSPGKGHLLCPMKGKRGRALVSSAQIWAPLSRCPGTVTTQPAALGMIPGTTVRREFREEMSPIRLSIHIFLQHYGTLSLPVRPTQSAQLGEEEEANVAMFPNPCGLSLIHI